MRSLTVVAVTFCLATTPAVAQTPNDTVGMYLQQQLEDQQRREYQGQLEWQRQQSQPSPPAFDPDPYYRRR
jgi:hypothetical protein